MAPPARFGRPNRILHESPSFAPSRRDGPDWGVRIVTTNIRDRIGTAYVLGLSYLPPGREAPVITRPKGIEGETLVREIGPQIVTMGKLIGECEEKYGRAIKLLDHPILGPLTGEQWRKFHFVHGRHHTRQITRLAEMLHTRKKIEPTPVA